MHAAAQVAVYVLVNCAGRRPQTFTGSHGF